MVNRKVGIVVLYNGQWYCSVEKIIKNDVVPTESLPCKVIISSNARSRIFELVENCFVILIAMIPFNHAMFSLLLELKLEQKRQQQLTYVLMVLATCLINMMFCVLQAVLIMLVLIVKMSGQCIESISCLLSLM